VVVCVGVCVGGCVCVGCVCIGGCVLFVTCVCMRGCVVVFLFGWVYVWVCGWL
jgi:hypothetical protein